MKQVSSFGRQHPHGDSARARPGFFADWRYSELKWLTSRSANEGTDAGAFIHCITLSSIDAFKFGVILGWDCPGGSFQYKHLS